MPSRVHGSTGKSNIPINTTLVARKQTAQPVNTPQSKLLAPKFNFNLRNIPISSPHRPSQPPPRINPKLGNKRFFKEEEQEKGQKKPETTIQTFAPSPPVQPQEEDEAEKQFQKQELRAKFESQQQALAQPVKLKSKSDYGFDLNKIAISAPNRPPKTPPVQSKLKVSIPPCNRLQQRINERREATGQNEELRAKAISSPSIPIIKPKQFDNPNFTAQAPKSGRSLQKARRQSALKVSPLQPKVVRKPGGMEIQRKCAECEKEQQQLLIKEELIQTDLVNSVVQRQDDSGEENQFPPGFDPEQKARELQEAFKGWGTDERKVFDILWTGRRHLTQAIEAAYNRRYSQSLEAALHEELSGDDLRRALQLLGHGELTLRDKLREAAEGWGTDEEKIFNALDRASERELNELRNDQRLVSLLRSEMSGADLQLFNAYLRGQGVLAGRLRQAVSGWGTDEAEIWRAIEAATPEERSFILSQPKLMNDLREDLSDTDWIRCERSLRGTLTNVDRIDMAVAGWGTDEAGLKAALSGLTAQEFPQLPGNIDQLLEGELSGQDLTEAREILHQKRLTFDSDYREAYLRRQAESLGEGTLEEGASVLFAGEGQSQSVIGRLKAACAGLGTDDQELWRILNSLTEPQRQFIREHNPEGVLNTLRDDLSEGDYDRAMQILAGGAGSATAALRQAVEGWGTDERLLYDAIERILREGVASELLADADLLSQIREDISDTQYGVFLNALRTGQFTPMMRLQWATAMAGTDEELIFELCRQHGRGWYTGGEINAEVDAILRSELDTRDYWQALDLIRGEPQSEEERLARAKEMLERERGGVSTSIMDMLSSSGEHADDAWREYQATYNRALEDGELTDEEQQQLRRDEAYSQRMTAEYREAKSSVAQWATTIAVAIVGIAATILTAGAAGPFVAGLAASLGGNIAVAAEAMVLAAALKVGLNRAIQGEGYDATSTQALVDAVSAGVEVGLTMVGGQLASRFVQGVGKTALARSVGPSVQRVFGQAGTRILSAGLEGSVDATIGGIGEGVIQGLAREETWSGEIEDFFSNMGESVAINAAMSGAGGAIAGAGFKSIGEVFGPRLRGRVSEEPTTRMEEPTTRVEEPSAGTSEPTTRTEEPTTRTEKPEANVEQPGVSTANIKPEGNLGNLEQVVDLPGGHKLKYAKNGRRYLCSPYCKDVTEFTDKFSDEIAQNDWIKTKLDEIADISDPAQFRKALNRLEDHAELFRALSAELKDLYRRLSDDAKEGFMQQRRLRSQKEFQGMENAYKNKDGTYDLERANRFFEGRRISGGRYETELAKKDFPPSWESFEPSLHDKFKERLLEFRGDKNIERPDGFSGGEGQLFFSDNHPMLTLKRWFRKSLGKMDESIRLLKGIKEAIETNPNLNNDFEVVKIHEQGSDWVIRDFDITTVPLPDIINSAKVSSKLQKAIEALEGTQNEFLQNLRGKLLRQPPSDNIHWSPTKQKFVIIDMQ